MASPLVDPLPSPRVVVEADAAAYVGDLGPAEYRRFFVRFTDVYEVLWGLGLMVPVGLGCGAAAAFYLQPRN